MNKIEANSFIKTGTQKLSKSDTVYALVYCRVSSKRQEKDGHGLQAQRQRCIDFATNKGYVIEETNVFQDTASGGGDYTCREGQVRLLKKIDAFPHRSFKVIVDETSRLARDIKAHFALKDALKVRGVSVESPNFNFDDSPEGEMFEGMSALTNQYLRKANRRQVIQKMKARMEAGYWSFIARRGYEMVKNPLHGKIPMRKEPDASLLKYTLEGFSTGIFPRRIDACRYLIDKGFWKGKYPEKYTDEFTAMLKDPFYMGDIEYLPWEVSRRPGHHRDEAIISEDTFNLNQRRLRNDVTGKRIRKDLSDEFKARGLIVCSYCGKHLTGATTTKGKKKAYTRSYYFCQSRECQMYRKSAWKNDVEKKLDEVIKKQRMRKNVSAVVKLVFDRVWKQEVASFVDRDMDKKQERALLTDTSEKLTIRAISSTDDQLRIAYEKQLKEVLSKIDMLDLELKTETDYSVPYRTALDKATKFLKSPYSVWKKFDLAEQHRLFFFIFEEKLWYDREKGYRTDKIQSYTRLFESFANTKPDNVDLTGIEPVASTMP